MRQLAAAAALILGGCAAIAPPACPAGLHQMSEAQIYFGRDVGGKPGVTDEDWQRFLDEEVTPRFPDGLTVEDAAGQWKGADGAIVREPSKHLTIVLSGAPDEAGKLAAVREAYKQRFRQESILLLETASCGSF